MKWESVDWEQVMLSSHHAMLDESIRSRRVLIIAR
jgi:hypothetical protein